MKPGQLIAALKNTGTGAPKLDAARVWLEAHPKATSRQLTEAMMRKKLWPPGTLDKAAKLLGVTITDDGVREDDGLVEEPVEAVTQGAGPKWKRPAAPPKKTQEKPQEPAPEI